MISRTFITEYLKLFFPNYDERYLDLLEIISDFTDPYIEAPNMAIIALDQNKRIVNWPPHYSIHLKRLF